MNATKRGDDVNSEAKGISSASVNTIDQPLRDIWYDLLREWCERTRYASLGEKHDIAWAHAVEYLATVEPRDDAAARTEATRQHASEFAQRDV